MVSTISIYNQLQSYTSEVDLLVLCLYHLTDLASEDSVKLLSEAYRNLHVTV